MMADRDTASPGLREVTRVRLGTAADAAVLADLGARTFREAFGADNRPEDIALYLSRAYGVPQQTAELTDPGITTLLVEHEGQLAGYAQLRSGPAPDCVTGPAPVELWRFYVDRPWHGRGVAQALMAAVRAQAVHRGAGTLWLSVWERNERAKAFYRKCGFLDVGSQAFILGGDRQTDRVMASLLVQAPPRRLRASMPQPAFHTAEDATPSELRWASFRLMLMLGALALVVVPILRDLPLGRSSRTALLAWLLVVMALYWLYAGMGYRPLLLIQLVLFSSAAALLTLKVLLVIIDVRSLTLLWHAAQVFILVGAASAVTNLMGMLVMIWRPAGHDSS